MASGDAPVDYRKEQLYLTDEKGQRIITIADLPKPAKPTTIAPIQRPLQESYVLWINYLSSSGRFVTPASSWSETISPDLMREPKPVPEYSVAVTRLGGQVVAGKDIVDFLCQMDSDKRYIHPNFLIFLSAAINTVPVSEGSLDFVLSGYISDWAVHPPESINASQELVSARLTDALSYLVRPNTSVSYTAQSGEKVVAVQNGPPKEIFETL